MADQELIVSEHAAFNMGAGVIDEFGHSEVVEMVDISGCEVEVSDEIIAEECTDQQLIQQEIKEEELEDAEHSVDLSQQGKRLLLKDWLVQKLDSGDHPNILSWYDKSQSLFRIKWLHKATDSWEALSDGVLFKEWCIHTGKYDPSNENPRKWKANFRCALNSLPDVIIVPSLCVRKGKEAYRVFKILPEKIPEKVREKQESSRKRRREKRESLLKAYAKNQEEMGNIKEAKAITEQLANNSSNIKIHLKRTPASHKYQSLLTLSAKGDSTQLFKSSTGSTDSTTTTTTTSGGKTLLNGMDALCTAAAMMADKPGEQADGENGDAVQQASEQVLESVQDLNDEQVLKKIKLVDFKVPPVAGSMSSQLPGDIVTYYRPIVSSQGANREAKPIITLKSPLLKTAVGSLGLEASSVSTPDLPTSIITSGSAPPPSRINLSTIPVIKPLNAMKLGSASISTSTGNVLLSVRLANAANSSPSTPTTTKIIQQGVPIPHISGFPSSVCIQPFSPSTNPPNTPSPSYLIPKTFLQQQIAASAGNQPARVYTVKPAKLNEAAPNPRAKAMSSLRSPPTDADYAHLKTNITQALEKEGQVRNLHFQLCRDTELIRVVRMYDSDKPNVEVSVTVMLDFTFAIVVHNRNLPSTHEILRKNSRTLKSEFQFVQLLERIGKYVACIGNPEEMAHRSYTDYSAFISAFQEPDLGAKNSILRYHSTIRSNSCHLLIRPPEESLCNTLSDDQAKDCYRCDECSRIRSQVLSMRGLFSLLDGSKVPDTDSARKKRLQLLRDFTTKEVLANRVDILETQIKRYQQLLPDKPVIPVSDGLTTLPESLPECNTAQQSMPDNTTQYVTSISESVQDGEVQNVIRVTLADASSENADITSDVDVVYHDMVVPAASSSDDIILVTGEDSMPPTERLLEELASGSLTNT